jgi:hypothetical protein
MSEAEDMGRGSKSAKDGAASMENQSDLEHLRAGRTALPEKYTKATVPLFDRQIAALDEMRAAIKRNTGASVMRAEIIRAALDAILDANIDLTSVRPDPEFKNRDLKKIISARLKG